MNGRPIAHDEGTVVHKDSPPRTLAWLSFSCES